MNQSGQGKDQSKQPESKRRCEKILVDMKKLQTEEQEMLILHGIYGMSRAEIAGIMGISEIAVMERLFYARQKLQGLKDYSERL